MMTIIKTVQSKILLSAFFAALFMSLGFLAACGGGGSGSSAVATGATGAGSTPSSVVVPPATCTTTPLGGPIRPRIIVSRVTGVAPLAVFFDASTTTATATTRPFHDLEYRWDFGDPAGGATWSNGSRAGINSKNIATGPVAAHVFETPGTYTVTLVAIDGTNEVTENCVQIAVTDPNVVFTGTNTICFSTSATFTGCPSGATTVTTSNFTIAISTFQATGKRLLFRRGETWTSATAASITATGPGIVGAFGTGARPIVRSTGNRDAILLSSARTPGISDWRLMDLEIDGQSGGSSVGVGGDGGINQVTVLRLNIHHIHVGFFFPSSILDSLNSDPDPTKHGHTVWDELVLVDSTVNNSIGGGGGSLVLVDAARLSILGNAMDDATASEHVIRTFSINKGVISNNTLGRPAVGKHVIKMHAPDFGSSFVTGGGFTEKVVLSDNKLIGGNNDYTVNIAPQNDTRDERLRDIIVERNWFTSGVGTQVALVIAAVDVTARNNIFDVTGGSFRQCLLVHQLGIEPSPDNVKILNNTCYSGDVGQFIFVDLDTTATNVTVQNNLAAPPAGATPTTLVQGTGASGLVQSNNLLTNTPMFIGPFSSTAGFKLTAGSPAVNTGIAIPVFSDFFLQGRPNGVAFDIGAAEF